MLIKLVTLGVSLGEFPQLLVRESENQEWYSINPRQPSTEDYYVPKQGEALLIGAKTPIHIVEKALGVAIKGSGKVVLNKVLERAYALGDTSVMVVDRVNYLEVTPRVGREQCLSQVTAVSINYHLVEDEGGIFDAYDGQTFNV